jgi:hypothetical protein
MSFQEDIARFNEFYFFREFTFSKNTFRTAPREEVELADNVVWVDEPLIAYQIKSGKLQAIQLLKKSSDGLKRRFSVKLKRKYVILSTICRITIIFRFRTAEVIGSIFKSLR